MPYVMEDVIRTRMIGLSSASLGYIKDVKLEPRILLVLSEYVRGCQGRTLKSARFIQFVMQILLISCRL